MVEVAGNVGVPGSPAVDGFGPSMALESFCLSVELHPSKPKHSVTPTLARVARTQLIRSPCDMMFPSPRNDLDPSASMPTETLFFRSFRGIAERVTGIKSNY